MRRARAAVLPLFLAAAAARASDGAPPALSTLRPDRLAEKVTTRLPNVPVRDLFAEVGRQTGLSFSLAGGLADCRVGAYLTAKSGRDVMALLLKAVPGLSYATAKRPDTYLVGMTPAKRSPCPDGTSGFPAGRLSMIIEDVHARTRTDFILWGAALKSDPKIRPRQDLKTVLGALEPEALEIRETAAGYVMTARGVPDEEVSWNAEPVLVTPGASPLFVPDPEPSRPRH